MDLGFVARLAILLPVLVCAAAGYAGPYVEVRGGVSLLDDMSGAGDDSAYSAELSYDPKKVLGAEGGMRGILDTPFGVGLALDGFRARLKGATVAGTGPLSPQPEATATEGAETAPAGLSADQVRALGFGFDHRVTVLSANAFYDIGDEDGLIVFLGAGFGLAAVDSDLRSGPLLHVGMRYPIDPLGAISLRATRFQASGTHDEASGLTFDSLAVTAVTLAFTMDF